MKFILGTKEEMTQVFAEDGTVIPVTVVSAGPLVVTQIKTLEKDTYDAIQVGFGTKNPKNINKAQKGHVKELGSFRYMREFRLSDTAPYKVGDTITVSVFAPGDKVMVTGISKGKGFQGVVKRHGFGGGRRTHGQKHSEREPGAIGGAGRAGGRVAKGMRMAGRMGGETVSVQNLSVVAIDTNNNKMLVSGAIPGRRGTLLAIKN